MRLRNIYELKAILEGITLFPTDSINRVITDRTKNRNGRCFRLITYQYEGNTHIFKSWVPDDIVGQYKEHEARRAALRLEEAVGV